MSEHTPTFNTVIPTKVMTPDQVSTRLGTLESFDGMPSKSTAFTSQDHLIFLQGVEAPAGRESNWIQTVPGTGWFTLLRLYGPLEAWFDQMWRPSEFELV
jgi:hypothetical protein